LSLPLLLHSKDACYIIQAIIAETAQSLGCATTHLYANDNPASFKRYQV